MKLYEIADEIEVILAREVDHETGEISDETLAALEALEMDLENKALGVAAYKKGLLAEAEAVRVEAQKLAKRAVVLDRRADWFQRYLEAFVPKVEKGSTYSDSRTVLTWKKNPPKAVVDDEKLLPKRFFEIVPRSLKLDKKSVLVALKAGASVRGARMVQESRLEVK